MESEAHKLNKQIQSQLEDSETLSKENNRLKEVVENDAKLLQEQQEKAHQALTEETTKVGTAQEEIKIVQAKLSVTEEELTKSKSALSEVESMMAQRLQETQSQLENASSDLEHAIMDKCTFEEELSEMKSARGDTDYIIATLKHELEEKQDKFVAIKALNDAAHQDLITKLQSAEAKLDTNLSQITSMESEAHKLNEQIQSQLEASETLSKENNRIKEVVENDAKLIHEQEKAHQALTEEITKAGTAQEEIKIVQAKLSVSEEELTKNKSTLSEVESMMTHQLQETQSQLENASSDLEHAIMDKCTLEEELREMKSARGDTDYTIATLKHELEEKQDKFVANNAENDAAHQDLITKLQSAEAKLDTNLSQITSMESEAHTLNEQIQSQLEASETLSRENNRLKEVVENDAKLLQEQQEKAHQALTEETTKAGTAQEEIKIVEAKLSVSEEELTKSKSALSEVESMMAHQLQETQSQLENASSDLEHAIMDKCTLEEELSEMKSARGDTDYTIATLKHELEEKQDIFVANKAQNDAANQDLITKLQSAEAKLDTNLSHITSMESEAHKLNEQVSFLKQTMHDTVANNEAILWEKNGALQAQIELKDSLKMNLDVMAEEYEKCKETLSQSMTEEVAQLESQLMFADEQAKVADNQLQEAKDLKSQLEEELVNLKDLHKEQICQLQQEIGVLQREKQDNKRFKKQMDQNKSTIEKLELNCQRFEATVDEYTVQILLLQSKLYSHEMTYDGLCESLNEERDRTSDLNKKNECLKTELAQVNTQLNAMKSASCSAKDEIGMKDLELTQAEELIKAKEESIANLESVVSALQEEKVDLEAKLESSLSKADELLASNESKDGEIGCLLDNFNELQQENAINAQCKTHVQGQLEDLKAEVTQLIDEVAETKAMNAQLSNNFDHFEEVNSNLEQQCSDLEHNLTSTQTQLQESNGKCSELEEKLDSLYDEKLKFNEELTSSYDNLESQKKDMVLIKKENDEMAFKLKSVTISYESKVEDLYRSLKANEEDVISKSAELMTMSVRYEEAEEQVAAFLGRLGERDHTIRDVEAQNEELVKQLNQFNEKLAASNGRVEELESSIMSAQASLADAEHQVAELSGDLEAAILAKMDAEEKVELLNEEATINKANLVSRSSLEDHIACIASLEATIVDANNVTEQLKTEVADKESTMKSLHEKLIALEEEKSNEKSDMAELTVKIQDFEQQLADKEFVTAKCSDLENQASQLKNDLTAHVKIQDELTEQLKHNQDLLTTSNRDLEVVKNQSDKYINEFEALRCELITSQEGLTRLETQNGQLLADKECMSSEISSLMERMNDAIKLGEDCSLDLQQCRGALKTSNEEIVEFKQKSEATEETCDKLRSEVIQLNQTISDLQELLEKKEGEFAQSLDELERGLAEKTKDCVTTRAEIQKFIATCEKNKIELDNSQAKRDECKKSNQVLEGQVAQLQTTVVKLEKDIISLKADKDSKMSKIKLLLGNQKKFESQMEQMSNQYEDLAKEKKAMVQQVAHRDALEAEVGKHQKRINELESEVNEPIGQMPWDIDPELQDMTPMELRSILAKELTPKEKAKLNAMCVDELVKEMKSKTSNETSLIWEISTLKKELQKNKIKLSHLEDKKSVARGALLPTDEDKVSPPAPKESSTATTTRKSKRRSVSSTTSTVLVQQDPNSSTRFTRSRSKTNIESDSNDEVFVTSATKKARQETSAVKTQENHPSVVVGGRPKRGRSSAMRLDVMPDNPFTTKKSTESSMTTKSVSACSNTNCADISHTTQLLLFQTKRPLETITNKTSKTSTKDD
jgi:chromosome segregation ATPase